ncbi:nuclear transport factor 2 family protein [Mesotoga sp. B105.6.4]|uniref:nuclear transport factor 2 family protein n=1 Tax=Mesotoga sp. B105.6.4 TaxID=1582224 RepID=UPI000CCC435F|nr:nuclear transport factor 2 family protein [Mesotoga sp. B105.6.4]PNS36181.1 limonene-1,2-epoxide hydrolase [Mesotoga sp. B105.6.4]
MDTFCITSADQIRELWSKTYNTEGKPDWSHILPYYDDKILFKDTIQEIRGIEEFKKMTERLAERSKELKMAVLRVIMEDKVVFVEWEMTILFKKTRTSVIYGASRLSISEEGKIIEQRDYYDLWGTIFDNIPSFRKPYRRFMRKHFG